jgi:RimJ/RimL family protein N-acetyltransferase
MSSSIGSRFWPFGDLVVRTGRLVLKFPSFDELGELAQLAHDGIHDPAEMPFGVPWTDASPEDRARGTMQWQWGRWASLSADEWHLPFVVLADDVVVGTQELHATQFAVRREVATGSWLGRAHQGRGIGTQMRAAVLHLAFAELGAQWATTTAYEDNAASNGVSQRLGYAPDGVQVDERRGQQALLLRYRLSREKWEQQERRPVEVEGVEPCLPLLGASIA